MSLSVPARRLVSRCLSSSLSPLQYQQRRAATKDSSQRGPFQAQSPSSEDKDQQTAQRNPVLEEYLRKYPNTLTATGQANGQAAGQAAGQPPQLPPSGDMSTSSIFGNELSASQNDPAASDPTPSEPADGTTGRDRGRMERFIDPNPSARERWERKKVIQMVRRGGRMTDAQMLKRTEREHLVRSHNLKTSVKKLGMLARQIAGKTLDEAIVQMRFSKKKAAVEVRQQLEAARDEAIVVRGMGLGQVSGAAEGEENDGGGNRDVVPEKKTDKPIDIQLKDGRRYTVTDRSKIYIDQAWVGRGPYGRLPDYRARGRQFIMRTPWTSISVVLKEEATRVREWQEREAKRKRQRTGDKVWTQMPDRPIQIQRQWYSW